MKRKEFLAFLIAPLLACFALPSLAATSHSEKACNAKNNNYLSGPSNLTEIEYGDWHGGYYDTTKSVTDTGSAFPDIAPYSLKEGKYGFHLNSNYIGSEIDATMDADASTVTFACPYFLPSLNCPLKSYSHHLIRNSFGNVQDLWSKVKKVDNEGYGQPSFTDFTVTANYVDDIHDSDVDVTDKFELKNYIDQSPDGTRFAVDGAVFGYKAGVTESFYEYSRLEINLINIKFTYQINNPRQPGDEEIWFVNEALPENDYDFGKSFEPSGHVWINDVEEVVDNFPSVPIWYEAAKSSSSHGSFKNKETAINKIAELMLADVNAHREAHLADYTQKTFSENLTFDYLGFPRTYTDYTGMNSSSFETIEAYDVHDFTHGLKYDIDIVPSYESITEDPNFRHRILKVYAFKHGDSKINEFIKEQATKFVVERNVIDHHRPIDPFLDDENENVIFKNYEFYKSTGEQGSVPRIYDPYDLNSNYSYIAPLDEEMTTGTLSDESEPFGPMLPLMNKNGFYSVQYAYRKWKTEEPIVSSKSFVLADSYETEEWQTIAQATGDEVFVNLYNELLDESEEDEYIINEDYDNKITFRSADALFIRVTKDDAAPEYHTAYATYSSDGVNPATLTKKEDYVLDMNEPGTYKIEFMNRTDTEPVSLTMHLLGDEGFGLTGSGNNSSLNLSIVNGSSKNLKQLTIQRSKEYSDHLENQTYVENLDGPVDPTVLEEQGFGDPLTQDESDTPKPIVPTTQNYEFKEVGATRDKPFNECFYVKAELLNSTKYFYLFWNYEIPEYTVTVNVTGEGTYSGSTTYKEGETTSITLTPNPGYKITEVSWNGTPYSQTDIYPQGMTIEEEVNEASTLNVTFSGVTYYTFTATYDNTQGTVSCKDKYTEFETAHIEVTPNAGYLIDSIRWNGDPVTDFDPSHYVIEDVLTKNTTMVVTFKAMEHPVTLTIDKNDGGSVSGGGTFEKGTEIEITITPYDGYEIESITLGEQALEIKTSFKITLENDITLKVRFKKIEHPAGGGNSGMIIGICCGVGALAIGIGTFLIIRAKKVGSMKK